LRHRRYRDAVAALQRAREEPGDSPPDAKVALRLAEAQELGGDTHEALRTYLETAVASPEYLSRVLDRAQLLLNEDSALALGTWLIAEWHGRAARGATGERDRMKLALFIGRVHLYLAEYAQAIDQFEEAVKLAPKEARNEAARFLIPEALPPAFRSREDGSPLLELARIRRVFGEHHEALQAVDAALDLGLPGAELAEAEARVLKAELLVEAGQSSDAAHWFYDAGRRFNWGGKNRRAAELLERAAGLRPNHARTYWYWMDALRQCEPSKGPAQNAAVSKALDVWDKGLRVAKPDRKDAWAYISRGLLNLLRADWPGAIPSIEYWEGVAHVQSALVLDPQNVYGWSYAGEFYQKLGLHQNALETTAQAVQLDPDSVVALGRRAAILAETGNFREAEAAIDRCLEVDADIDRSWARGVKAFILLHTGRLPEAEGIVNRLVDEQPEELWNRQARATCRLLSDRRDEASPDLRMILDRYDPNNRQDLLLFAWAAYHLGDFYRAKILYEVAMEDPNVIHRDELLLSGLCSLLLGDVEAGRDQLLRGVAAVSSAWDLDYHEAFSLKPFERYAAGRTDCETLMQVVEDLRGQMEEQRDSLSRDPPTAEGELARVQEQLDLAGVAAAARVRVGLQGARAQLSVIHGRWREAGEIYHELSVPAVEAFPVARDGLLRTIEALEESGTASVRDGNPAAATAEALEPALELARKGLPDEPAHLARLLARTGYARLASTSERFGAEDLVAAIRLWEEGRHAGTSAAPLADSLWPMFRDTRDFWRLDRVLQHLERGGELPRALRSRLRAEREALVRFLDERFGLLEAKVEILGSLNLVTRVAIEVDEAMVPENPEADWSLFRTHLPNLRQGIQQECGVLVPGVRVRGHGPGGGGYIILIDDLPVASGRVCLGRRYCPAPLETVRALDLPATDVEEAANPMVAWQRGAWIAPAQWERLEAAGFELWEDEAKYVTAHLEAVLRCNLADLLGLQEVEDLLERWATDEGKAERIKSVLPNKRARLAFSRVLRALVTERVPILALGEILEAVAETGLDNDRQRRSVAAARLRLRSWLPGNGPHETRLEVPEAVERALADGIHRENGRVFFALPPDAAQALLSEIRALVTDQPEPLALVVRDEALRPFARELLRIEFPSLMVLSAVEVLEAAAADLATRRHPE
jgi:tetratricopeptide (TPR) repeat protein